MRAILTFSCPTLHIQVNVEVDTSNTNIRKVPAMNVIADTQEGSEKSVVVTGFVHAMNER